MIVMIAAATAGAIAAATAGATAAAAAGATAAATAGATAALDDTPVRPSAAAGLTENVILFTFDGLRWQEVFSGADEALLNEEDGHVDDVESLREAFWRETPQERRRALMPFFWTVIVPGGQVLGNVRGGSRVMVTNGLNFSYPCYNEMLVGFPDDRIDSNAKRPNANITVLEWLNGRPSFSGRVAAFTSWDVFPYIINEPRSGVPVNAGWEPITDWPLTDRQQLLNDLMLGTFHPSEGARDDALTFYAALEHLERHHPRVLYISLDRTDISAHNGRYDRYLKAAHKTDDLLRILWEKLESMPRYAGKTTLLLTSDHGRGDPPDGWRGHGENVPGAELIWLAVIGPDTAALGERSDAQTFTQAQIAATVAGLLGEDYGAEVPRAAPPLPVYAPR